MRGHGASKKAQKYGEYLEKLSIANKKKLTPSLVVHHARSEDSPIHNYFDWDNTKAAARWRLHQARNLLNGIQVVVEYENQEITTHAFFNVTEGNGEVKHQYVSVEVVAENQDYKDQVIQRALSEVKSWQARYSQYKELGHIFGAIEKTQKELKLKK